MLSDNSHDVSRSMPLDDARNAQPERWYVVQTHQHCETLAEKHLTSQNLRTYLPKRCRTVRHARSIKTVCGAYFDGYLFVSLDIQRQRWSPINSTVGVRKLVAAAIAAHRAEPQLHRVLAEQIPHTGALTDVEAFNREAHSLFRTYLEGRRDELRGVDLDLATFVCVTSIEALTHNAVLHRAEFLTDAAAAALVDEATRLVLRYLL